MNLMQKIIIFISINLCFISSYAFADLKYAEEINVIRTQRNEFISISSGKFNALRRHNHYLEIINKQLHELEKTSQDSFQYNPQKSESSNKLSKLFSLNMMMDNSLRKIDLLETAIPFEFDEAAKELEEFPELMTKFKGKKESILKNIQKIKQKILTEKEKTQKLMKDWEQYNVNLSLKTYSRSLDDRYTEKEFISSIKKITIAVGEILSEFAVALKNGDYQKADEILIGLSFTKNNLDQFFLTKLTTDGRVKDYTVLRNYIAKTESDMIQAMKTVIVDGFYNKDIGDLFERFLDWLTGGSRTQAGHRNDNELKGRSSHLEKEDHSNDREIRTVRVAYNTRDEGGRINGLDYKEFDIDTSDRIIREKSLLVIARRDNPLEPISPGYERERYLVGNSRTTQRPDNILRIEREEFFEYPQKNQIKDDIKRDVNDNIERSSHNNHPSRTGHLDRYLQKLEGHIQESKNKFPDEVKDLEEVNRELKEFEELKTSYASKMAEESSLTGKIQENLDGLNNNLEQSAPSVTDDLVPPSLASLNPEEKIKERTRMIADLSLGIYLGTVYDFADFVAAMALEKSLLGEDIELSGKVIRGVALVPPFVSAGMLTHGGKALSNVYDLIKSGHLTHDALLALRKCYKLLPKSVLYFLSDESGHISLEALSKFNKEVGSLYDALDEIPQILRPVRVKVGTNGKIAIIGRTMGNEAEKGVSYIAKSLAGKGHDVEIFSEKIFSQDAKFEFDELIKKFPNGRVPDDIVKTTKLFEENLDWANKIKNQDYTILDLGDPYNKKSSVWFEMEKKTIFGDAIQ